MEGHPVQFIKCVQDAVYISHSFYPKTLLQLQDSWVKCLASLQAMTKFPLTSLKLCIDKR